jgi:hypothetical protein
MSSMANMNINVSVGCGNTAVNDDTRETRSITYHGYSLENCMTPPGSFYIAKYCSKNAAFMLEQK